MVQSCPAPKAQPVLAAHPPDQPLPSLPHPLSTLAKWLERAREALKREVTDIQQQHVQLAAGLNSAVAAAAAAPASPQKQLAAQVGGKTCLFGCWVGNRVLAGGVRYCPGLLRACA